MARAARVTLKILLGRRFRRSAELFLAADQRRIAENFREFFSRNAQRENRCVAVHHGRNRGIERVLHAEFGGKFLHPAVIGRIDRHQHIGDSHAQPLFAQKANGFDGALERVRQLGDGIVHFGTMRVDADLDRVYVQGADSPCFLFVDHDRVGLDLDVEHETPGVFDNLKEVAAQEDFAAAESEKKNACLGQLIEHVLDFGGRHLAVVVVIEITMHAALIAAIRDIHVHGEGDAQIKCFLAYFGHQGHQGASAASG